MIKKILSVIVGVALVFFTVKNVSAAYLTLTRIGTVSTSGLLYSEWTISGVSPDFAGTATPGAMVAVTVNAVTATTSAGISGVWVLKPNNIVTGANTVSIASGNESVSFLLRYTPVASPTAAVIPVTTTGGLPEAGGVIWPVLLIGGGLITFILGRFYKDKVAEEWNI